MGSPSQDKPPETESEELTQTGLSEVEEDERRSDKGSVNERRSDKGSVKGQQGSKGAGLNTGTGVTAEETKSEDDLPVIEGKGTAKDKPKRPWYHPIRIAGFVLDQWFIVGLVVFVLLAWGFPNFAKDGGTLRAEYTIDYGVIALIFLITGLTLSTSSLYTQLKNIKLHLLTQIFSFLFFPAVIFAIVNAVRASGNTSIDPYVLAGMMVMATMPTTIASNVTMTRNAKGNVESATLEVCVGNLLGIFITPLLLSMFLSGSWAYGAPLAVRSSSSDSLKTIYKQIGRQLGLTLFLPLAVGQVVQYLRPKEVKWAANKLRLQKVASFCLLLIIWAVFSTQFAVDAFNQISTAAVIFVVFVDFGVYTSFTLLCVLLARLPGIQGARPIPGTGSEKEKRLYAGGRKAPLWRRVVSAWRFDKGETTAVCFCAAAKGLAVGAPILSILYGGFDVRNKAIISIPLVLYQGLQILVAQIFVNFFKRWNVAGEDEESSPVASLQPSEKDNRWGSADPIPGNVTSMPYTIAMISDFFLPVVGGIETHVFSLALELQKRGHKVIVITHSHPPSRIGIRYLSPVPGLSIKVYHLPILPIASSATLPQFLTCMPYFRDIFIREGVEIVHGHGTLSSMAHEGMFHAGFLTFQRKIRNPNTIRKSTESSLEMLDARLEDNPHCAGDQPDSLIGHASDTLYEEKGIRTVFTDHSLFGFDDAVGILTNKLLAAALRNVDGVICVSHTGRENTSLRAELEPGIVSVIPNAFLPDQFKPDPSRVDSHYITIVVVSRLVYRKGIDLLVAAIPTVCRMFPDVRFIIGGDGPKMVELEQMQENYLLQDRVKLLGRIAPNQVRDVLVQGQIYLATSLTEAFGISIIEAACAGLFVVSTKVGGVPEILPPDMIEFATPNATDVIRALTNAIAVVRAGTHDPQQAHHRLRGMYSWDDIASRTERVYQKAMAREEKSTCDRMARLWTLGPFFGPILCCITAVQGIFLMVLDILQPRSGIDKVP